TLPIITPKGSDDPLTAVMVFIHGGGFNNGSGTSEFYGPDYIVNEAVILVTINYRLGALGFLSTGDSIVPGNNGLKDQVMAFKWIQQNIAKFGGDPYKVTIFGESAGGASVHYHMLSPMSRGLFSGGIAQSGSALNPWAFNNTSTARSKAFRFGEALGCKTNDSKELLDFLNTIPAQELVEGVFKAMTEEEERDLGSVYFRPTVEEPSDGEEIFLPAEPLELLKQGKFHNVPFIAGVNSSEGLICLKEVMAKPAVLKKYDSQFEILVPRNLTENTEKGKEITQKIKTFYFGDAPVSQETLFQYVDLSSDTWFVNGVYTAVKLHAAQSTAPVYCYMFSFDGQLGFLKRLVGAYRFPGVCHCDELGYLFFSPYLDIELESGCPEEKIRSQFVKMWTNFAKTGNPSLSDITWEPFSESKPRYLNIDTEPHMDNHLLKERMAFWEDLTKRFALNCGGHLQWRVLLGVFPGRKLYDSNVSVVQGKLRGREATTKSGATYYSFQGIPYAKPPTGPLRFRAPQPADSWKGMRDALVEGPVCPQMDIFKKEFKGEEDCLYLNVYTPKTKIRNCNGKSIILIFLHGAIMTVNEEWMYDPILVAEDIVLVTFNYRLGPLGFLSTGDSVIPGNNGLKDQVMALRWIQQNIAQFGGDPGNVTIFGNSSGGACVHYQMLSPMSEGLFHHAISQSGTAINPWAFDKNPRLKAFSLGQILGCRTNDSTKLIEYLRNVPVQRLIEGVDKLKIKEMKYRGKCLFTPALEHSVAEGEEIFLEESPKDLISQGKFHKIPYLTGINSHEGLLMLKEIQMNPQQLEIYNNNFELFVRRVLYTDINDTKLKEIAQEVKKFYFGDKPLSQDTLLEYVDTLFMTLSIPLLRVYRKHDRSLQVYILSYDLKVYTKLQTSMSWLVDICVSFGDEWLCNLLSYTSLNSLQVSLLSHLARFLSTQKRIWMQLSQQNSSLNVLIIQNMLLTSKLNSSVDYQISILHT
ncbi:hypothetical protein L9F63_010372, partial [Diploptera punctata]